MGSNEGSSQNDALRVFWSLCRHMRNLRCLPRRRGDKPNYRGLARRMCSTIYVCTIQIFFSIWFNGNQNGSGVRLCMISLRNQTLGIAFVPSLAPFSLSRFHEYNSVRRYLVYRYLFRNICTSERYIVQIRTFDTCFDIRSAIV